jgi:hypothetical protein
VETSETNLLVCGAEHEIREVAADKGYHSAAVIHEQTLLTHLPSLELPARGRAPCMACIRASPCIGHNQILAVDESQAGVVSVSSEAGGGVSGGE